MGHVTGDKSRDPLIKLAEVYCVDSEGSVYKGREELDNGLYSIAQEDTAFLGSHSVTSAASNTLHVAREGIWG